MTDAKGSARAQRALPFLAWSIASCVSATLVHAAIGIAGNLGAGGETYGEREHGALGPVALTAVLLLGAALLRSALRTLSRPSDSDPLLLMARRFASRAPLIPWITVTLGSFALLLGMEFAEQLGATGHIQGVSDALGGNVLAGTLTLTLISGAVAWLGLRSARAIVSSAITAAGFLAAWISVERGTTLDCASTRRRSPHGPRFTIPALLGRSAGLRAPPLLQS